MNDDLNTFLAFDSLPNAAMVRQRVVLSVLPISAATLWRMVNSGKLPKPYKIGPNVTAWSVGELRQKMREMMHQAESCTPPRTDELPPPPTGAGMNSQSTLTSKGPATVT